MKPPLCRLVFLMWAYSLSDFQFNAAKPITDSVLIQAGKDPVSFAENQWVKGSRKILGGFATVPILSFVFIAVGFKNII